MNKCSLCHKVLPKKKLYLRLTEEVISGKMVADQKRSSPTSLVDTLYCLAPREEKRAPFLPDAYCEKCLPEEKGAKVSVELFETGYWYCSKCSFFRSLYNKHCSTCGGCINIRPGCQCSAPPPPKRVDVSVRTSDGYLVHLNLVDNLWILIDAMASHFKCSHTHLHIYQLGNYRALLIPQSRLEEWIANPKSNRSVPEPYLFYVNCQKRFEKRSVQVDWGSQEYHEAIPPDPILRTDSLELKNPQASQPPSKPYPEVLYCSRQGYSLPDEAFVSSGIIAETPMVDGTPIVAEQTSVEEEWINPNTHGPSLESVLESVV